MSQNNQVDQTYYEILEVSPDAPQHEIHKAYQRAKRTYSPDSPALYTMFTEEEARDLLRLIEEAYAVLGNNNQRSKYDQRLAQKEAEELSSPSSVTESELPDPVPEGDQWSRPLSRPTKTSTQVPEGYAKTRFSIYEVDPEFEHQIRTLDSIDGSKLKRIRLYKKITLDQISRETRISRNYLAAIEANDYEALPAAVFVRGFVVQIARILELDEKRVAQSYMQSFKQERSGIL